VTIIPSCSNATDKRQGNATLGDNEILADHKHIEADSADLRDTQVSGVGVKEISYYSNLLI
jgi:hypothetical protein